MLDLSIIDSPSHYVTGRKIEPIYVIEDWKLDHDHYLACVVKYIARAGRKNPILEDLKKAEWYLDRSLSKANIDLQDKMIPEEPQYESSITYLPQSVCDDWQLSDNLCNALTNIYISVERQSHLLKEKALNAALDCLREEIHLQETRQNLNLAISKKLRLEGVAKNKGRITMKKIRKNDSFQFSNRKAVAR